MEQERPGRHEFRIEIIGIDNFAKFCALLCGEAATSEAQARVDALATTLNQSSDPLAVALDKQKDKEK